MRIGFIGKGALGLLYAPMAQQQLGPDAVCFIMDDARFERHANDVYTVNGEAVDLRDVCASEALADGPFDLLLLAVKATGLQDALEMAAPLVGSDTIVIPLLNGITSEQKCAQAFGWDHVIGCVSYGMDAARFGTALKYTNAGALKLGLASAATPYAVLNRADKLLAQAGIPHEVSEDVRLDLWRKFIANVGLNQTCMVYNVCYEQLFADQTSEMFRTYIGAMREVIAVGNADGVALTEQDMNDYIKVAQALDPKSRPSMAQDRANGNKSEVDEFSGEVIRLAEKHGLWVPCNRFLNARVKEIEASYVK